MCKCVSFTNLYCKTLACALLCNAILWMVFAKLPVKVKVIILTLLYVFHKLVSYRTCLRCDDLLSCFKHGLTPLHLAAQSGHEVLVRVLLNSPGVHADAKTTIQGSIPLHLAAQNGHTSVVSLLLSKSTALISIRDKRDRTALHLAANTGQLEMVALLLGQGSNVNLLDKVSYTVYPCINIQLVI